MSTTPDKPDEPEMQPDTKLYEKMDDDWDDALIRALDKKIAERKAKLEAEGKDDDSRS